MNETMKYTIRVLLYFISLYFLFEYTERNQSISTNSGLCFISGLTILAALMFWVFVCDRANTID